MSNEVEASTTNGQPDQQAAPKAPSKKEKKKGGGERLLFGCQISLLSSSRKGNVFLAEVIGLSHV